MARSLLSSYVQATRNPISTVGRPGALRWVTMKQLCSLGSGGSGLRFVYGSEADKMHQSWFRAHHESAFKSEYPYL